jgi:hypothetical protein
MLTAAVALFAVAGTPLYVWLSRKQAAESQRSLAWFKSSIEK